MKRRFSIRNLLFFSPYYVVMYASVNLLYLIFRCLGDFSQALICNFIITHKHGMSFRIQPGNLESLFTSPHTCYFFIKTVNVHVTHGNDHFMMNDNGLKRSACKGLRAIMEGFERKRDLRLEK